MKRELKHVTLFFIISCVWTWVFYCAIILFGLSPYAGSGMILLICGGCSPTFVGLIMVLITYDKADKLDYIKRCYQVKRIKAEWWLFILMIFPAIYAISIMIDLLMGGMLPEMANIKAVFQNPVSFIPLLFLSFMSGPFSEELGWRGYALEPLLDRMGFIKASVLIGVIWGIWHWPLFFMPETWHGQMGFKLAGFWMFMLSSVGHSIIISFVFIKTNQSILSSIFLHLGLNFTGQMLAKTSDTVETTANLLAVVIGVVLSLYQYQAEKKLNIPVHSNVSEHQRH